MSGPLLIEASSLVAERIALIIRDALVAALVGVASPCWILILATFPARRSASWRKRLFPDLPTLAVMAIEPHIFISLRGFREDLRSFLHSAQRIPLSV